MTPDLSRRLGIAIGMRINTPAERAKVVTAARRAETWEDLPQDVRDLVVEIETRFPEFEPTTASGRTHPHLFTCTEPDEWHPGKCRDRSKPGWQIGLKPAPPGAIEALKKAAKKTPAKKVAAKKAATPTKPAVPTVKAAAVKGGAADVLKGDLSSLKRVGPQLGSNPGGTYEAPDGSRWYVKKQRSKEHAANEALANDLYRMAGIEVPDVVESDRGPDGDADAYTASRLVDTDASTMQAHRRGQAYIDKVRDGFAVDAWLANWDVYGEGKDNLATTKAGTPVRIDAGGSLLYRARGGLKGDNFGSVASEWDSLRNPSSAPDASLFFKGMTDEQLIASAARLRQVSTADIADAVKRRGLPDSLTDTLARRRNDILARADALEAKTKDRRIREAHLGVLNPTSPKDMQAMQDRMLKDNPWTAAQERAVKTYTDEGFEPMNARLRKRKPDFTAGMTSSQVGNAIKQLNAAMRPLPEGIQTYRSTQFRAWPVEFFHDDNEQLESFKKLVGRTLQDPGFMSTTIDPKEFSKSVWMQLDVPPGVRGAYVDSISAAPGEKELILAPGLRYRVDDVSMNEGGQIVVKAVAEVD